MRHVDGAILTLHQYRIIHGRTYHSDRTTQGESWYRLPRVLGMNMAADERRLPGSQTTRGTTIAPTSCTLIFPCAGAPD